MLQAQEKLDEAEARYEHALALKPDLAEAHHCLGNTLQVQDKLEQAVACYERALALQPSHVKAHYDLGCTLRALGNVEDALVRYRIALAFQPDSVPAGFRESLAQLLSGDFTLGLHNYERRWQSKDHGTPMRAIRNRSGPAKSWHRGVC